MKNAHLRFGHLTYTKVFKKTNTRFRVPLDRFIGEPESGAQMKAHLISVVGGDTQIAALSAAVANRDSFSIDAPDGSSFRASLGANAECYRGSLQAEGQKRPLRHMVAVSEELVQTTTGKATEHAIIFDSSSRFVWASLAHIHGVPGIEEWADWVINDLMRLKAIDPLIGIGCNPVLVNGSKGLFMNSISRGLREGRLRLPENNGPVDWSPTSLSRLLVPELT